MLVRSTGPEGGKILVRQPYRAEDYTPDKETVDAIKEMSGWSVRELLDMHDGPFNSSYYIDKVEREGKTWWQFCHVMDEWCLLIEDSSEPIKAGAMKAMPPEEARQVSKGFDARRGTKIVDAA